MKLDIETLQEEDIDANKLYIIVFNDGEIKKLSVLQNYEEETWFCSGFTNESDSESPHITKNTIYELILNLYDDGFSDIKDLYEFRSLEEFCWYFGGGYEGRITS